MTNPSFEDVVSESPHRIFNMLTERLHRSLRYVTKDGTKVYVLVDGGRSMRCFFGTKLDELSEEELDKFILEND